MMLADWSRDVKFSDLVREVAAKRLVAFIGSGVSKAANCPTWFDLLKDLLTTVFPEQAKSRTSRVGELDKLRTDAALSTWFSGLLASGDYLLLAELLQDQYPGELLKHIKTRLDTPRLRPSPLHQALTTVSFSQVLTTNYDQLLEQAYQDSGRLDRPLSVYTWKDPLAILRQFRHNYFTLVKLHGTVDKDETMITTKNDYVFLLHHNAMFQACLKTILLTKTLLFIGHSLRDPDLLSLLNEIARQYRDKDRHLANPHFHYALLPESEANELSVRRLREDYNIHAFVYSGLTKERREKEVETFLTRLATESSKAIVTKALTRWAYTGGGPLQDLQSLVMNQGPLFVRDTILQRLLKLAVMGTGSLRGDLCLIKDEWSHAVDDLLKLSEGPNDDDAPTSVHPQSVIGTTFLTPPPSEGDLYIYLPDVGTLDALSGTYPALSYVPCHRDVSSELAVQIIADGQVVGVLNLESSKLDAYSADYLAIARDLAKKAGGIYSVARDRNHRSKSLQALLEAPEHLTRMIHGFAGLEDIDGVLYAADYNIGRLRGRHCGGRGDIGFLFTDEHSFAARVLRQELPELLDDVERGVKDGKIDRDAVTRYDIRGVVYGTPVVAYNTPAGVFVAWSKDGGLGNGREEIVRSIVHLIVNDPSDGFEGSERIIKSMNDISQAGGDIARVAIRVIQGMRIERVRLWRWTEEEFECFASSGLNEEDNMYQGKRNSIKGADANVYCQLIYGRFLTDSHARIQGPTMYGPDPKAKEMGKDPMGDWIVAPLVSSRDGIRTLVGYIAADNHVGGQHNFDATPETGFVLRALDAIATVMATVMSTAP